MRWCREIPFVETLKIFVFWGSDLFYGIICVLYGMFRPQWFSVYRRSITVCFTVIDFLQYTVVDIQKDLTV